MDELLSGDVETLVHLLREREGEGQIVALYISHLSVLIIPWANRS